MNENIEARLASIRAARDTPINPVLLEWEPQPRIANYDPGIAAFEAARRAARLAITHTPESDI